MLLVDHIRSYINWVWSNLTIINVSVTNLVDTNINKELNGDSGTQQNAAVPLLPSFINATDG